MRVCLTVVCSSCRRNGNGSDAYAGVESGDEDELSGIEIDVGSEDEEEFGGVGERKGKRSHAGHGNGRRVSGTVPTSRFVSLSMSHISKVLKQQHRRGKPKRK